MATATHWQLADENSSAIAAEQDRSHVVILWVVTRKFMIGAMATAGWKVGEWTKENCQGQKKKKKKNTVAVHYRSFLCALLMIYLIKCK